MLADALPDKFGNILIDEWLVRSGRDRSSFTPVERLCYVGARGMGALEFEPVLRDARETSTKVDVGDLVSLAAQAIAQKKQLDTRIMGNSKAELEAMRDILRVRTSAGGARAKAVIAWNESTGKIRSGQIEAPSRFGYWLLKNFNLAGAYSYEQAFQLAQQLGLTTSVIRNVGPASFARMAGGVLRDCGSSLGRSVVA